MNRTLLPPPTARASGWVLRTVMDRLCIRHMAFVRYLEGLKKQRKWDGIASRQGMRMALTARTISPRLLKKLEEYVGTELFEAEISRLWRLYPEEFITEEN